MFKYKPHPFPKEIEIAVFKDQNGKCCHCGVVINLVRDRPDHIIPQTKMHVKIYSEERIQSKENCQIPCLNCHANKGSWSTQKIKDLKLKWEQFNKSKLNTMKTTEQNWYVLADPQWENRHTLHNSRYTHAR